MTTALTTAPSAALLEQVLISGDLSKLSAGDRVMYYKQVCESVGLNPLTKPFEYITLNGKLTLYALRSCTEQLRQNHGVSVIIKSREVVEGCYVVTAQATDQKGRHDESIGAVPIDKLVGEARSNAMMKAETKAKRRVTLSICGLGMIDETEVDSIPAARATPTAGYLTSLPAARQEVMHETAALIKEHWENDRVQDGYALIEDSKLNAEEMIALWSLLPSNIRSAHKRMKESERAADKGVISPAQHKRLEALIKERGIDRNVVKAYCKERYGTDHFTELDKEQYKLLDKWLDMKPAPPESPASPAPAAGTLPAPGGAAPTSAASDLQMCLEAVKSVKGQRGASAVQMMIDTLDDMQRPFAQEALDARVAELKAAASSAPKQTRKEAEQAVRDIASDTPFKPTQGEL